MKNLKVLFILLCLVSCAPNTEDVLTGKWFMFEVIQEGKDVTSEHNPHNERFLILKDDNTFESGGRPFGKNTGKFVFDSKKKTLFLDSDAGPEDDSNWNVSLNADTMHWRGYGSEWAENFELIQIREKK